MAPESRSLETARPEGVRVLAHTALVFEESGPLSFAHPLVRRMTPLQKALIEAVHRLRSQAPEAFARAVVEGGCPVYFATALGELSSNLGMLGALQRAELPLSPTAFQHSVHNCAAGYLSIVMHLKNPMTTLCAGARSGFKALALAAAHVRRDAQALGSSEGNASALVLLADACSMGARAEALLLAHETEAARPGLFLDARALVSLCAPDGEDAVWPWLLGPGSDILIPIVQCDAPETQPLWISRS